MTALAELGDPDRPVLVVSGEVDYDTAPRVRLVGLQTLDETTAAVLRVDLSAVSFLDSSGLGAIAALHTAARERDRQVVVVGASPRVRELFAITGMDVVLTVE